MQQIKRSSGSGGGTSIGYTVEARVQDIEGLAQNPQPLVDGRTILGHEWQQLHFEEGSNPYGVPGRSRFDHNLGSPRMPLKSAIALAWTIIAQNPHRSVECQIVRHKLTYTYSSERLGVVDGLSISDSIDFSARITDDVDERGRASE